MYKFLLPLLFISIFTTAQDSSFVYTEVIELPDLTKSQLFQNAITWSSSAFSNGKVEIDYKDKEEGKLIAKGYIHTPLRKMGVNYDAGWVYGTYSISVKDRKYKYTFENFQHEIPKGTAGRWIDMGPLNGTKKGAGIGKRPDMLEWKWIKDKFKEEIQVVITKLKTTMAKTDSEF